MQIWLEYVWYSAKFMYAFYMHHLPSHIVSTNNMPLIDADINNVPDQENVVSSNQWISLKGKTRVYFILFMYLHVRMIFPLNHIFRSHHSYSIESWSIIMNQMLNFIAFWAYIQQFIVVKP